MNLSEKEKGWSLTLSNQTLLLQHTVQLCQSPHLLTPERGCETIERLYMAQYFEIKSITQSQPIITCSYDQMRHCYLLYMWYFTVCLSITFFICFIVTRFCLWPWPMDGITLWFVASSNLAQAVFATIFHQLLIFCFISVAVGLETHGGKENAR